MKNLLYILKQSSTQTPNNYTNTTVDMTILGLLIIGFIAGVILTVCVFSLIKMFRNKSNNSNDNNTNNTNKN